jgi:hypothetical protein
MGAQTPIKEITPRIFNVRATRGRKNCIGSELPLAIFSKPCVEPLEVRNGGHVIISKKTCSYYGAPFRSRGKRKEKKTMQSTKQGAKEFWALRMFNSATEN